MVQSTSVKLSHQNLYYLIRKYTVTGLYLTHTIHLCPNHVHFGMFSRKSTNFTKDHSFSEPSNSNQNFMYNNLVNVQPKIRSFQKNVYPSPTWVFKYIQTSATMKLNVIMRVSILFDTWRT